MEILLYMKSSQAYVTIPLLVKVKDDKNTKQYVYRFRLRHWVEMEMCRISNKITNMSSVHRKQFNINNGHTTLAYQQNKIIQLLHWVLGGKNKKKVVMAILLYKISIQG